MVAERGGFERLDIGRLAVNGERGELFDEGAELLVARDEIGLAVDVNKDAALAAGCERRGDDALGGGPVGAFLGPGDAALAQHGDGRFHIPACFLQGVLAVHHAHAGLVTELFDERCANCHRPAVPCWWSVLRVRPSALARRWAAFALPALRSRRAVSA